MSIKVLFYCSRTINFPFKASIHLPQNNCNMSYILIAWLRQGFIPVTNRNKCISNNQSISLLCDKDDVNVQFVTLGCPHYILEEMRDAAQTTYLIAEMGKNICFIFFHFHKH